MITSEKTIYIKNKYGVVVDVPEPIGMEMIRKGTATRTVKREYNKHYPEAVLVKDYKKATKLIKSLDNKKSHHRVKRIKL